MAAIMVIRTSSSFLKRFAAEKLWLCTSSRSLLAGLKDSTHQGGPPQIKSISWRSGRGGGSSGSLAIDSLSSPLRAAINISERAMFTS